MNVEIKKMTSEQLQELKLQEDIDRVLYALWPEDLEPLVNYVERGVPLGGFLSSVVSNDLALAVMHADLKNRRRLVEYIQWLYNEAPSDCWGSRDQMNQWIAHRGKEGVSK